MLAKLLAASAVLPVAASFYFVIFWSGFGFWRKHLVLTAALLLASFGGVGALIYGYRALLLLGVTLPLPLRVAGWALLALMFVFGTVADRQIGLRVRAFIPFFERGGKLALRTTGAYAVVRHPIYASGIGWQLGVFLVTGSYAVAAACAIFTLSALWFTRKEEQHLVELLDDPAEYQRYREKVGRLFPRLFA